jgi:hypothetical protein
MRLAEPAHSDRARQPCDPARHRANLRRVYDHTLLSAVVAGVLDAAVCLYAEFFRAFRRWTGVTPQRWRSGRDAGRATRLAEHL